MSIMINANREIMPLARKIEAYSPFVLSVPHASPNVMQWSDNNYTARLIHPKLTGGLNSADDYTGSTFRDTSLSALSTNITNYFGSGSDLVAASGTVKLVCPEWFDLHKIRYVNLRAQQNITQSNITSKNNPNTTLFLSATKFVHFYYDTGTLYGRVSTYSGGVWTTGSAQTILASSGNVYDATLIDSSKIVLSVTDNSLLGGVVIVTESGGTLTAGSRVIYSGANAVSDNATVTKLDTDKFIMTYRDTVDANKIKARAATVSGTTPTFGTAVDVSASYTSSVAFRGTQITTDKVVVGWYQSGEIGVCMTTSGTTITVGTVTTIGSGNTNTDQRLFTYDTSTAITIGRNGSTIYLYSLGISGTTITLGTVYTISATASSYFEKVEGGFVYFGLSNNKVYKLSLSGGVFTTVYSRQSSTLPTTSVGSYAQTGMQHAIWVDISGRKIISARTTSTTIGHMQLPVLSLQVGSETSITSQTLEFELNVDMKSNLYKTSYFLITRTDADTESEYVIVNEILLETK